MGEISADSNVMILLTIMYIFNNAWIYYLENCRDSIAYPWPICIENKMEYLSQSFYVIFALFCFNFAIENETLYLRNCKVYL